MTNILDALKWRYATKVFDHEKMISEDDLHAILEAGRLSPSSFGVEPWKFIVVENTELRAKIRAVGFDQPKITDAAYLIVIARRTDARANLANDLVARTARIQSVDPNTLTGLGGMVSGFIATLSDEKLDAWVAMQCYIPLGVMVGAASMMGIDNGPMEGFNPVEVDKILGLPEKHLASTTFLTFGHRGDDPAASQPKVRRDFDEVVEFVK